MVYVRVSFQISAMEDDWGIKDVSFAHISWNDVTDAELSGDQEAIEKLM